MQVHGKFKINVKIDNIVIISIKFKLCPYNHLNKDVLFNDKYLKLVQVLSNMLNVAYA